MASARLGRLCLVATAVCLIGCVSPAKITKPAQGPTNNPVTLQVKFDKRFQPPHWSAYVYLDDVSAPAVTAALSPAPGKNVTSNAPLDLPAKYGDSYTVRVNIACGVACAMVSDPVTFTPPKLFYNGTTKSKATTAAQYVTQPVFAGVQYVPTVPISVKIKETTTPFPLVQLGASASELLPVGTPLTVTIPAGTTKADFYVKGQSLGTFTLELTASGVKPGTGTGKIVQ